ncbi:MAG: hypothetical protein WBV59_19270, partial [Anaerolineae bacterium]
LTFRNHTLLNPDAIVWLNQFAAQPLNDRQRLALVYLRANEQLANRDYQRLNRVDSVTANRELRRLVETGLTEQHSTRRWAYYTLSALAEMQVAPVVQTEAGVVLRYVQEHGSISNAECRDFLKTEMDRASYLLKKMHKMGLLSRQGERRWARYFLP